MNLSLPTSLKDVFRAPTIDHNGNRLNPDWSVNLPPYKFIIPERQQSLRFASYQAVAAWPNLYDFVGRIIDGVETSDAPQTAIRQLAVDLGQGSDPAAIPAIFVDAVVRCRGLLTVAIIGIIMSWIVMPLVSGLTYYFARKRYQNEFRHDPYSSDSMAAAAHEQNKGKPFSPASVTFTNNNFHRDFDATPSYGMRAMAVIAIVSSFCAAFGLGGSFYFNDSFSFSLNRSTILTLDAMDDISLIIDDFTSQFDVVASTVEKDIKVKMDFGTKALDAFGNIFKDSGVILELAQKSMAFGLFFIALTWESSTIRPLEYSIEDTRTALTAYIEAASNVDAALKQDAILQMARSSLCQNVSSSISLANLSPACRSIAGQILMPTASSLIGICQNCIAPDFPDVINPFALPQNNLTRVQRVLASLNDQLNKLGEVKFGEITINQEDLMKQLSGLQTSFKDDFSSWVDFYMNWYDWKVKPITEGGDCSDERPTVTMTYTQPVTTPTTPWMRPVTNVTRPTNRTTVRLTTTTEAPITELPQLTQADIVVNKIREAFNDRHYITLALLIVATIQVAAMIAGSVCLLIAYHETAANQDRSFRFREPSNIEKAGRYLIIGGAVVFVAFTGPLLSLLAAAHFFVGGFVDKSVCNMIRKEDYGAFDRMLGDDFLKKVLPDCIVKLVNSFDEDMFNRVTVTKFLNAARNDETLNELLRFENTTFLSEVKSLKHLTLTSRLAIYNAKIDAYLKNLTDIAAAHGYFQALVNSVNMDEASRLNETVKGCTTCVLGTIATATGNDLNSNMPSPGQLAISSGPNMAAQLISSQLTAAQRYKQALSQYLVNLPPTYDALADMADTLAKTVEKRDTTASMMRFVENYFQVVISLVKSEMMYIIGLVIDRLVAGVTEDVVHMGIVFDFYDGLAREYACLELIGAMNAFWFFVGIYLFFAGISALLLFATYGVLNGFLASKRGRKGYWHNRNLAPMNTNKPSASTGNDNAGPSYPPAAIAITSNGVENNGYSNNEGGQEEETNFTQSDSETKAEIEPRKSVTFQPKA